MKQETYSPAGQLLTVTSAPDASGHLTSTTYATDGTSIVLDYENGHQFYANHYDASGKITSQDRFDDSNRLISTTTAPDPSGHLVATTYAADKTSIVTDYEGGQKSYANHYDAAGRITSQDRFDSAGNLVSTSTAPDAAGRTTATDYDRDSNVIAQIAYSSAETTLNAIHQANGATQSATYALTTGDGILPIGFTTGSSTSGDTFTFASNHIVPSHTTILGFDPEDHVILNGYDPTHFSAQEDGTNVTLTLSDQSVVFFDHVAHVADLHLVWT